MRETAFREDLGRRCADQLTQLLELRPDVAAATPVDLDQLARLLSSRASLHSALQSLNRPQLDVLERAAVLGNHTLVPASDDDRLRSTVHDVLHAMALIHPVPTDPSAPWVLSPAVADALGRYPAGLGRPLSELSALRADSTEQITPSDLDLDHLPGRTAEILANFRTHPVGTVREAHRSPVQDDPLQRPIDWLLARKLLVPIDPHHVEMPREVGLALRGGDLWDSDPGMPVAPEGRAVNPRIRDNAAQSAVLELVRDLKRLRAELSLRPLTVLQSGGVGVRERRRLAAALDLPQDRVDRLLGHAYAAGLVEAQERTGNWTSSSAPFESLHVADAHGVVLAAWWNSQVLPSAVGTHGADGAVVAPLTRAVETPEAPGIRLAVSLAVVHADQVSPEAAWAVATATWMRPRLAPVLTRYTSGLLTELADLGLTGAGAAAPALGELVHSGPHAASAVIAQHVPAAVETVTVQNDHTAVAAGPLSPSAAAELALVADPEGRGAADTFRFSVTSLQRALEHGYDAAALTQLLEHRLGGAIPQSLVHLVDEALRTHGALRIQDAQQVVTGRADLVEALAHAPELDRYQILRPSPEVLILKTPESPRHVPLKRDPLRTALLSAAERAGVQPTVGSTTARTPVTGITGDLGELLMLFTPAAPAAEVLDPDHLRTVATRLAQAEQEGTDG
ncbi:MULTISPECIES: helicase-associated domain-containing protein [Kocuria]|uniref:Helicase XPB/Ssl2 N-terminal domain-containing protein n=1 Tax=Kocuria subflava TaxID=1736139 RepID=A0A846U5R3_9MICC|nr:MULTISPECIES: helicase-associated domain-containing protein [Kocuria]NKE09016.1 hypothetical protein [Kocuria subflava]